MMPNFFLRRTAPLVRQFGTSSIRRDDHDTSGIVGSTLPFSINNKYKLTVGFIIFFGSGLALPYLLLRRGLLKERS